MGVGMGESGEGTCIRGGFFAAGYIVCVYGLYGWGGLELPPFVAVVCRRSFHDRNEWNS